MAVPVTENPFAILTLVAAPAVFTNASSVLALGTSNRLARVVDRTRQLSQMLQAAPPSDISSKQTWVLHLERQEKRAILLVRAMSFFYSAVGAFAAASLVSLLGASLVGIRYNLPFEVVVVVSLVVGTVGIVGLSIGCALLVKETHLALLNHAEEARQAKGWAEGRPQ
ncbi:MAG TPA: DUF2721 domain-containing protein [Candidatus Angelobacter sp.]|nr:DUF2721 domain-containing protein [Candidatus Angelobacter sp.]